MNLIIAYILFFEFLLKKNLRAIIVTAKETLCFFPRI